MIHSLSGGVIADNGPFTFAKVQTEDTIKWYLSPLPVKEGDEVLVPFGAFGEARGVVVKTETCSRHTAPVPISRAQEIIRVL